jgi:hypothetical protein
LIRKLPVRAQRRYCKYTFNKAATACHGYGLLEHYYLYYFYLFPQKMLKTFKFQEKLKKTAKNTLKKNSNLAKEVKQIQKLIKKKKKKKKKKNQTVRFADITDKD